MKQSELNDLVASYGDQVEHINAAIARVRLTGPQATPDAVLAELERSLRALRNDIGYLPQMSGEDMPELTREVIEQAREHAKTVAASVDRSLAPQELEVAIDQVRRHFADIVRPFGVIGRWPPDNYISRHD